MSSSYAAAAAGGAGWRPPFTASQWQELEHQALIFKYLVAGVPVPPELLVPILKSFESMAARFYHHPTSLGYCSLYGKKLDPEPWRCRRTDGKKWRCSKNAYPDSKYCERHMHRGRNRSRKPVETTTTPTTLSQQPPTSSSSSTVTTLAPSGGAKSFPCSSGAGMIPLPSSLGSGGGGDSAAQVLSLTCRSGGLGQQLQMGPAGYYYQMAGGDNCSRYNNLLLGVKSEEVDEHNFLSEASAGSATGLGGAIEASLDNPPWQLMPSQLHNGGGGGGSPPPPRRPQSMQDFDREASSSLCAAGQQQKQQQQQHCFFGSELDVGKAPAMKQQQGQPLLPFFDEWPKYTRDSWSDLDQDDRSNNRTSSLSTTQLSISMPVAASSSDFSATSSRSPNGGGAEED